MRWLVWLLAGFLFAHGSWAAGRLTEVHDFGSNPGKLQMLVYVPAELPPSAGLVVVAHGCFQTAVDIEANSGWVALASAHRFALVFPQSSRANESWGGCFRTWQPEHQQRGAGEPLSISEMVGWMLQHHKISPDRVFVTGMSSGGLLTNIMLATYPELFAAGAPQSAYFYRCAESFAEVATCAAGRKRPDPHALGELVRNAYPGYRGPRPRVSIWHGSGDRLLLPLDLNDQLYQWADVAGIDDVPDRVEWVDGQSRLRYEDSSGAPVIETVLVRGLDHAIAVSPRSPRGACGKVANFFSDVGICAAERIAEWFGLVTVDDSRAAPR